MFEILERTQVYQLLRPTDSFPYGLRKTAVVPVLTLLGLGLIKINTVLASCKNPRPSLTLQ